MMTWYDFVFLTCLRTMQLSQVSFGYHLARVKHSVPGAIALPSQGRGVNSPCQRTLSGENQRLSALIQPSGRTSSTVRQLTHPRCAMSLTTAIFTDS